ncbi:TPA: carboxypeptidase regulatory-like domain-containing protein, partial [Staphylococcus aureus]|nr:carboxypeptidase regulatory-like domain-containing protein [Staphylococcus aureus]
MLNRENKTAMTRKGMVSNRLNKFSIRKYTVGTASILVGTTLIFGLGSQEAKAAEVTNKEMKEDATSVNNDQVSKKVDTEQLNNDGNTSKVDTEQLKDENINKVANQKEVTRVENSVASEKNNNSKPSENGKLQTSDVKKTEDNNATSDDQVTTTVNSQQLNTDNTTSMSSAPINVRKDDLKFNNEEVRNVGEKSDNTDNANSSELIKPKTTEPKRLNTRMRIAAIQPNSTDSKNVNDLITSNTTLTVVDADNSKTIVPAQDYLSLKSQITVDDKVKSGDYFTIKYSDTVQVYGLNPEDIKNIGQINQNVTNIKIYRVPEGYTLNKGYDVNANDLVDVTDEFKNKMAYGTNQSVNIDFGDITSAYVVMVNTKFQYTNSESPTLVQMATLSSTGNKTVSTGNALGFTNNQSGGAGQEVYKIGNYVWEDTNKNGVQELGEKGVGNVTVTVFDNNTNTKVGEAVTKEDGSYLIPNLPNGDYRVEFSNLPQGYEVTPSKQGNNEELDSNGVSSVITVNGKDNLSADLGIYKPKYNLGDYVWEDINKNGIQDQDEKGISGVTVTLKDENGNVLKTVTTDADGKYKFTDLDNGNYKVEFTTPEGYTPTSTNTGGNDTVDSNGLTTTGVINGADNMTLDSGFYKTPKYNLGNYVWEDTNKDGKQDSSEKGISGVTVTLKNENGEVLQTTKTDKDGKYQFTGLENGTYKVEFETPSGYTPTQVGSGTDEGIDSNGTSTTGVIKDKDNDTIDSGFYKPTYNLGDYVWEDTNKNGVQDKDEKGISGVTVTLKDENDKVLKTVTTDENGKYQFTDLNNGTYKVEFETPSGYTPTSVTTGNDTEKDSNGLTTTGVIKDADNMTLDSGFYKTPKYSLGDYVWYDSNKDGKQDSTEKGIKDVKVTLLNEKGEVIGTTKTDENGKYRFDNLDSGKYKVIFENPAGLTQTGTNTTEDDKDADGGEVDVTIT